MTNENTSFTNDTLSKIGMVMHVFEIKLEMQVTMEQPLEQKSVILKLEYNNVS